MKTAINQSNKRNFILETLCMLRNGRTVAAQSEGGLYRPGCGGADRSDRTLWIGGVNVYQGRTSGR